MSALTHAVLITMEDPRGEAMSNLRTWCLLEADGQVFEPIYLPNNAGFPHQPGGRKIFCDGVYALCGKAFPYVELLKVFPILGWGKKYLASGTSLTIRHSDEDVWHAVDGAGRPLTVSGYGAPARHCHQTLCSPQNEYTRCTCPCESCVYARCAGVLKGPFP